ncbi:MAG: HD domain-containing protein [Betaproteobacteria bacterium]|nr:HD domain-containing protein [Betaproteobacteria bacterium]
MVDNLPITNPKLKSLISETTSHLQGESATAFIQAAIPLCQRLNLQNRSFDALPITQACTILAERQKNPRMRWQSATAAGIILGYCGEYAGAIAAHSRALHLAEAADNVLDQALAWLNLGNIFKHAAAYELAIECYSRAHNKQELGIDFSRYGALVNMAQCHLHLDEYREGIAAARLALYYETDAFRSQQPYSAVVLRSNYVRLLVGSGRAHKAKPYADQAYQLAAAHPSPQMTIVANVMRSAMEISHGHFDTAISRLKDDLHQMRPFPEARNDTLVALIQAEKAAGNFERAVVYLQELADHIYRQAATQAHQHLELSSFFEDTWLVAERNINDQLDRYHTDWDMMPEWDMFERLAQRASLTAHNDGWHGVRVGELARLLALADGYSDEYAYEIGMAARLHDIGLIGIPAILIQKTGPLSAEEIALMQRHTLIGFDMLQGSQHPRALIASHIACYHHEHWQGGGYPNGLAGNAIPKVARLTAIVDAFDDMITGRPYREQLSIDEACAVLEAEAGKQFDPNLVNTFLSSVSSGLIGENFRRPQWLHAQRAQTLDDLIKRQPKP